MLAVPLVAAGLVAALVVSRGSMEHGTSSDLGHETSTGPPGDQGAVSSFASILATLDAGRAPLTVLFRATDLGHGMFGRVTGYRWAFGDGAIGEGLTTQHAYTKPGNYRVSLTITYEDGSEQVSRKEVQVR